VIDESGEDYLYPADCFLPIACQMRSRRSWQFPCNLAGPYFLGDLRLGRRCSFFSPPYLQTPGGSYSSAVPKMHRTASRSYPRTSQSSLARISFFLALLWLLDTQ